MRIPGGIDDGQSLRLAGQGEVPKGGGGRGDLYVTAKVKKDPRFERRDFNLVHVAHVPFTTAALGGKVSVPTLEEESVEIELEAGTQPSAVYTLHGRGITRIDTHGRGDLDVVVQVEVPKRLNKDARALLEKLAPHLQAHPRKEKAAS